ncbi:MAG: HEAT repeat domain-containing protein [Candidatus Krumholzibacteriota bacterium]
MKTWNIVGFVFLVAALAITGYALADEDTELKMQEAREFLNQARYEQAAQLLKEVYELQKEQQEAGNALYWQAFARYKLQKTHELKIAAELLRLQQEKYGQAETAGDGEALLARLYGELAERGEIEGVREIHELSDDEMRRDATRVAALEALMRMDPDKALPILEKIVTGEKKTSEQMRRHSVFILCRMDDERSEDLLIDMLNTTDDPEMLSELVMCLSMKDSERALDAIIDLFKRVDDPEIDEAAMFAIGRHGGDKAFQVLADIVRDRQNDLELRRQALYGLSHTGRDEDVTAVAVEILQSDDEREMIETALFALARAEGDVPDQIFIDLINNPRADEDLRTQALYFAAQREQLDLDFLKQIYAKAESRDMKQQICHVITRMDDEEAALDALIEIIRTEDDPEIKQEAVFWVSRFDSERAAEFLLDVINDE